MAGNVIVCGFAGLEAPAMIHRLLSEQCVAGLILFKRNIDGVDQAAALIASCTARSDPALPILVCVDQEGGRVARFGEPVLRLPPMQTLAVAGRHAADARCGEGAWAAVAGDRNQLGLRASSRREHQSRQPRHWRPRIWLHTRRRDRACARICRRAAGRRRALLWQALPWARVTPTSTATSPCRPSATTSNG